MTNILDLFARILISTLFLINGIFKITNYDGTVDWMVEKEISDKELPMGAKL